MKSNLDQPDGKSCTPKTSTGLETIAAEAPCV
jgi:hypothetical protein